MFRQLSYTEVEKFLVNFLEQSFSAADRSSHPDVVGIGLGTVGAAACD
jgi:hypothetical protein